MSKILKDIKERHAKATPGPWEGSMNYPFYAILKKPAPSLSKHDDRPAYWRIEDALFVVNAHKYMAYLLHEIECLENLIREMNE